MHGGGDLFQQTARERQQKNGKETKDERESERKEKVKGRETSVRDKDERKMAEVNEQK